VSHLVNRDEIDAERIEEYINSEIEQCIGQE
jgi:hypothetical protein